MNETPGSINDDIKQIVLEFEDHPSSAWLAFSNLGSWEQREKVVELFDLDSHGWVTYLRLYREKMEPYICESFYCINAEECREKYDMHGEINIPFLKEECLSNLSEYATNIESHGNHRYNSYRPTYPPGEVVNYNNSDQRKHFLTQVNMTAIACRHMHQNDALQWIYHSPHLRVFLASIMCCRKLYPYISDLGLAINIMRPRKNAQNALGFHFDSIDSSGPNGSTEQPKGATGVIGIQDCMEGGERVVFPSINRCNVQSVSDVLLKYNPLRPSEAIGPSRPVVFYESIKGMLYLFNGGNVLHGVSSVRAGQRIAAVFMFQEEPPKESSESSISANFFYKSTNLTPGRSKM